MSEDYLAQQPTATWNPVRGVWETNQVNLLCGHLEPYLETWQTSGMTQNGQAFALPTPGHRTTGSESSSLPTPTVSDQYTANLKSTQQKEGSLHSVTLAQIVNRSDLLPTTRVSMANGATKKEVEQGNPKSRLETEVLLGEVAWGRFRPAIKHWETITGRAAPKPTKIDSNGNSKLSSELTEWLMGLPKGWITDCGLTWNEELKAAGNGVVPQQAYLALEILLGAKS